MSRGLHCADLGVDAEELPHSGVVPSLDRDNRCDDVVETRSLDLMAVLFGVPEDTLVETDVGVHLVDRVTEALVQFRSSSGRCSCPPCAGSQYRVESEHCEQTVWSHVRGILNVTEILDGNQSAFKRTLSREETDFCRDVFFCCKLRQGPLALLNRVLHHLRRIFPVHVQLYTFSYRKPVFCPQNMPKSADWG